MRRALWILVTGLASALACGGSPAPKEATTTPGGSKDPSKWPADDRSMCDWKNKPELEVSETAGPGAIKPNVRRVYKTYGEGEQRHKTLICREIDTNLDGIKDVVRTFDAKGEPQHEEADTNYDGKIDNWVSFADGRITEEELDTNGDGKPDVWKYYVNGQLSRIKRDTHFTGKPDVWEIYTKGHLEREGIDTQADGHVDVWYRDGEIQRAAEAEDQKARNALLASSQGDGGAMPTLDDGGGGGTSTPDAGKVGAKPKKK